MDPRFFGVHSDLEVDHHPAPIEKYPAYGESIKPVQRNQNGGVGKWTGAGFAALLTAIIIGITLGSGLGATLSNYHKMRKYVLPLKGS
jgi:hypothetical protein